MASVTRHRLCQKIDGSRARSEAPLDGEFDGLIGAQRGEVDADVAALSAKRFAMGEELALVGDSQDTRFDRQIGPAFETVKQRWVVEGKFLLGGIDDLHQMALRAGARKLRQHGAAR